LHFLPKKAGKIPRQKTSKNTGNCRCDFLSSATTKTSADTGRTIMILPIGIIGAIQPRTIILVVAFAINILIG
jgi:hypothetical protein